MNETMTCSICGRKIRSPAFWRHSDACRKKHGGRSGKPVRDIARRLAKKYSSVLRAFSKPPAQHLEDIYGKGPIGPQDVIDALALATNRKELNWVMGCTRAWSNLVIGDGGLWPADLRGALWTTIWEVYALRFKKLRGQVLMLREEGRKEP